MHLPRTLLYAFSALMFLGCPPLPAAEGDPGADADWAKVQDAMEAIRNPVVPINSEEESHEYYKKALPAFDVVALEFYRKHPEDPRRWRARLIENQTIPTRTDLGVTVREEAKTALQEIVAAQDADTRTKSEASTILVVEAERALDGSAESAAAWEKLAQDHLTKFPLSPHNEVIQRLLAGSKASSMVRGRPLDLKFTSTDGREVNLADLRGKVVLLDFWATHCPSCVEEMPALVKTYRKLAPKGFEIVGISVDESLHQMKRFIEEVGVPWPQYNDGKGADGELARRFGIDLLPVMWLLDRNGLLVNNNVAGKVEQEVEKLLAQPAP